MKKHYTITVQGRVQGVGFRYHARACAEKENITGYVKNMPDGSVLIEAEGEEEALSRFLNWCHQGPPHAHVISVTHFESPLQHFHSFFIK